MNELGTKSAAGSTRLREQPRQPIGQLPTTRKHRALERSGQRGARRVPCYRVALGGG